MSTDHESYIKEKNAEALNAICPFVDRKCTSECMAYISADSYTVKESSPFGAKGQVKRSEVKCKRLGD